MIKVGSKFINSDFQWEADMETEWVLVNPSDINKMINIKETDEVELISMNQYKPIGFVMTVCRIFIHEDIPEGKIMVSEEEFAKFAECDLSNILLQDRNDLFMKHRFYTGKLKWSIKQLLLLTIIMECKRVGVTVTIKEIQNRLFSFCNCKNDCLISELQDNEIDLYYTYLRKSEVISFNHDDTINTDMIHIDLLEKISLELDYITCFANRF